VLFIAHWIACVWYIVAVSESPHENTWLDAFGYRDKPILEIYIAALYWSFATMTTVGYGEIHPVNSREQIFGMLTMLLACGVFAFFIGNIGGLIRSLDSESAKFRAKNKAIKKFLVERDVPLPLQTKVKRYLQFLWANGRDFGKENKNRDEGILGLMSNHLRGEVMLQLLGSSIKITPFLSDIPSSMLRRLCERCLTKAAHAPGDVVYEEGELASSMHFLVSGRVKVVYVGGAEREEFVDSGGYFGELALFLEALREGTARCIRFSETVALKRSEVIKLLPMYPKTKKRYEKMCRSLADGGGVYVLKRKGAGVSVQWSDDFEEGDEDSVENGEELEGVDEYGLDRGGTCRDGLMEVVMVICMIGTLCVVLPACVA
ncbi:hypothetical protein FOZ62_007249, partial [Perkinsus olseni]